MPRELITLNAERERAFLVGLDVKRGRPLITMEDSLDELALLADTAGIDVVGQATQHVAQIDPATFIGSGKADEIRDSLIETGAQTVIFDDELTPRHQRELEKRFGEDIKVLDRSALILDIFAQHAHTHEGALQVELAQYEYRLPRLTRQWTHLSRQAGGSGSAGGVGLRGPGETQLEVDRREIRERISRLKSDLEHVREHRSRHRAQRDRTGVPLVALVGYTNAGKSTLMRAMTGSDVYIANQLFATLDPTTRRVNMPSGRQILLTDTVGFIQKLPATLIAAFRATLEEIAEADLLLEVVDSTQPNVLSHIETVEDTLAEIDVPPVPRILVWNKIDARRDDEALQPPANRTYAAVVPVSALTGEGVERLAGEIERVLAASQYRVRLMLPYDRGDLISQLHSQATVYDQEHREDGVLLSVHLPASLVERFRAYRVTG